MKSHPGKREASERRIRRKATSGMRNAGGGRLGSAVLVASMAALFAFGCVSAPKPRRHLNYTPEAFRTTLSERVPELPENLSRPPFDVDEATIERARDVIEREPLGPPRVEALVRFLSEPEPKGLGIVYDWSISATAARTLELRRGNCFALASVLVGLGRGLGWPIYYAEARPREPETQQFEEVKALSDHMVVLIVAKTVKMFVDFTGLLRDGQYHIRPIDDLTAYAHLINNMAGQRVMSEDRAATDADWQAAREGFELATRIEPQLGRAWNNLGIVYRRLGRIEEARDAYQRAVSLEAGFGSAQRNLSLMETRAQGGASVIQSGGSRP
jgi:tetratricopeptide (TPR) repeat protein